MKSESLKEKPCNCGGIMREVIGYQDHDGKDNGPVIPIRRGWYCRECKAWEPAIYRERIVEDA